MIELFLLPADIPDDIERNRPIVILDIFRASTSMAAALNAGAEKLYPAGSIEEADSLKNSLGPDILTAGERGGYRIEGYDFGNSPLEMTPEIASGKKLIFNSTNGTKLYRKFDDFENVIIGSFVCMSAVVEYLKKFETYPVICCAGQEGRFSGEDTLAAGMLISRLKETRFDWDDASEFACLAFEQCGDDWRKRAMSASHGRMLASIGLKDDLPFCTDLDRFNIVPVKSGDGIIRFEP